MQWDFSSSDLLFTKLLGSNFGTKTCEKVTVTQKVHMEEKLQGRERRQRAEPLLVVQDQMQHWDTGNFVWSPTRLFIYFKKSYSSIKNLDEPEKQIQMLLLSRPGQSSFHCPRSLLHIRRPVSSLARWEPGCCDYPVARSNVWEW